MCVCPAIPGPSAPLSVWPDWGEGLHLIWCPQSAHQTVLQGVWSQKSAKTSRKGKMLSSSDFLCLLNQSSHALLGNWEQVEKVDHLSNSYPKQVGGSILLEWPLTSDNCSCLLLVSSVSSAHCAAIGPDWEFWEQISFRVLTTCTIFQLGLNG